MTSKERMLTALAGGVPDRLPITIHQWQEYHLATYMGGVDELTAARQIGLDAAVTPRDIRREIPSPHWVERAEPAGTENGMTLTRHTFTTPDGDLTLLAGRNEYTEFVMEHLIKDQRDAEIFLRHAPRYRLDLPRLTAWYDRTGDSGIVRGSVTSFFQPGTWQSFCELVGTEQAIYWSVDDPAFVHAFLEALTQRAIEWVEREWADAKFDLVEHGGGAASANVISPAMFDTFCLPYDRRVIAALHAAGHKVVYHTCGWMMPLLERIPENGCDASETLSPPGVGGDIATELDRQRVKRTLGRRVALIGGIDQAKFEQPGHAAEITADVRACFRDFGAGGGYICSASDHFFHADPENLRTLVQTARECTY
ncbi:uroporphyrinogen decarboxylase family protein [Opitutus sp. ER46]|uniref:uroporphyrinogen decarboxylase family protein n=1 Tax=Opitutus sp. ER46 TaxID=2161864 RepID=UPI000D2F6B4D|nr:uroporphyrinogen decarboxylase family protein [Opitutus sp. ER46]PTX95810.1 hypothetical protein DB354_10400 [Opitutus sp. ER46]